MDKYQKFGIFTLLLSLFLIFVLGQGDGRILYLGGLVYSAAFIFYKPIKRIFISRVKRPLLVYGILVLINGLFIEVLAYFQNLPRIQAGEQVFLFDQSSLLADLFMGLPYYIAYAIIFLWLIRRFEFTTFEFTLMIGLAQASMTDVFTHFIQLFVGGLAGIIGFIFAGFVMLFTLSVSYVWFEDKFKEVYPTRSRSWVRFPIGMVLQLIPLGVTFALGFVRFNILR